MENLNSLSVLSLDPHPQRPHGSNWGRNTVALEFLHYNSVTVSFVASECIKRYWESVCGESK